MDVTIKFMLDSQKIPYSEKDIKEIEHSIMYMNLSGTWPTVFKPEETECNNCSSSNLSSLQPHPGKLIFSQPPSTLWYQPWLGSVITAND